MRIATSLKGLFWAATDTAPAAPAAPAAPVALDPAGTGHMPVAAPAAARDEPGDPAAGNAPLPDVDFAAIYAQTSTAGDPKVDQVMTAFEAMQTAIPAAQLAVAVAATAKAIGADPAMIIATLTQRLTALDTTMTEEQAKAGEREAARNAELATLTQKVHAEIDAMEHKCAAFRQQLAAATERVHQKTAGERTVIAAFGTRARGEADRLKALRDFLAPGAGK